MVHSKSRVLRIYLFAFLQLFVAGITRSSHQVVESLPGYPGKLPFRLETGYISVGDSDEIELFYYFIESMRNPVKDPLMLWLTGGPGCSAFSGLVYEIGPLTFDYEAFNWAHTLPSFVLNENSWTEVASIIFLDAPVGTGFSYSTTQQGYETSDTKSIQSIYQFMRKWLVSNPIFSNNPLYISGDSYSGMIVPQVTLLLSQAISAEEKPVCNLQGYVLGNPVTDPIFDENSKIELQHRLSLISDELYESVKTSCKGEYVNPNKNNSGCIYDLAMITPCIANINPGHILEPQCLFTSPKTKALKSLLEDPPFETLRLPSQTRKELWCRKNNYVLSSIWANDKKVQEALHIRNGTISSWKRCNKTLAYDRNIKSVVSVHKNLIQKGYRALIYSGDHDIVIPYVGTKNWIDSLNLTVVDAWRPWFVNSQVAGYTVNYKEHSTAGRDILTYATVKGGGHTAPEYKPEQCIEMIDRWLAFYYL